METLFMVHFLLMQQPFNVTGETSLIRSVPICHCASPEKIHEGEVLLFTYNYNFPGSVPHQIRSASFYENCDTNRLHDDRNCCCTFQAKRDVTIYGQLFGNATGAQLRVNGGHRPIVSNQNDSNTCNISNCRLNVSAHTNFSIQFLNLNNTQPYSMLMAIKVGQTDVGGVQAGQPARKHEHRGKSADNNRPSWHSIFLIIAAILMGLALAFLFVGIILFKLSRSRPAKKEADMEQMKPQDTYEDIADGEGGRFLVSGKIEKDPPSKGSNSYRRLTEASHTTELSSTLSFDERASGVSKRANGRTPSPSCSPDLGQPARGKTSITGQCLGFQMSTGTNNAESENYYSVENEDYEDMPEPSLKPSTLRPGIKVATPFVLAMNSGECLRKLKPIDRETGKGQLRAISSAKAPIPTPRHFSADNGSTYMGLNRTGRAHSTDLTQSENYNDLNSLGMGTDTNLCKNADVLTKDSHDSAFVNDLKADRRADDATYSVSYEHGKVLEMSADENKSRVETEEEHIYEAYDHGQLLKRGSSCLAKSNVDSSERGGVYELAKLVNDPLQQDLVIIDVRSSKNSNIDEEAGTPEQCPSENPASPTLRKISEKLTDKLPMTGLALPTEELKSTMPQLTDKNPQNTSESSSKGARDFPGTLANNTIESTNIPEKSIDSPQKSIDSPQKSIDSPKKSIDSPQKSIDSPKKSIDSPQKSIDSPQKSIDSPQKSIDSPQKSIDSPQKSIDSPKKSIDSPQKSIDSPQKSIDSPQKSIDSPQKSIDSPQKSIDSPQKSIDSPQKSIDSPQKSIDSPKKSIDSPQKSTNTPEKSIATGGITSNIEEISNNTYSEVTLLTNKSNSLPGKSIDTSEKSMDTSEKSMDTSEKSMDTSETSMDTSEKSMDTLATSTGTLETFIETVEKSVDTSKKPIDILKKSFDTSENLYTQGISPALTDVESNIETRELHAVNNVADPGKTQSQTKGNSNTSPKVSSQTLLENTTEVVRGSGSHDPLPTGETVPLLTGETVPLLTGETVSLLTGETVPLLTSETITRDESQSQNKLNRNMMADKFQDQMEIVGATPQDMAETTPDVQIHPTRFIVTSGDVSSHTYTLLEPFVRDDSAT